MRLLGVEDLGPRPADAQHALQAARARPLFLAIRRNTQKMSSSGRMITSQRQQLRAEARAGRRVLGVDAVRAELLAERRAGLPGMTVL